MGSQVKVIILAADSVKDASILHLQWKLLYAKPYPDDIPPQIWNNEISHTVPLEGDNGIQFEAE